MPKFDYQCEDCGHEFEFFLVRTTDIASCPACSSLNLTKKASMFAVAKSRGDKRPPIAATVSKPSEPGHTCTSACNHGKTGPGKSPIGCGVHYADSLRKKYGYERP